MSEERELHAAVATNAAFYAAFAQGDIRAMDALWSTSEPVLCTHPGAVPLRGRSEVMEGWAALSVGAPFTLGVSLM